MTTMIPNQFLTTGLEAKHDTNNNECNTDERRSGAFSAARVSVITSTYSLPSMTSVDTDNNEDNALTAAEVKQAEKKDEAKKPYGGRPLKYECPECQRRFHAPSHLKRHVMSHSSERPFQCSVCGKGFLQAWHLGRHMTTHTGNKPFKCVECSKSFGSRFEMRTHINYIHKGIKEHKCDVCGKHFTLRSNLKVHMRKHTGEKPYQCTFCSKRFGQRGHLQYHIRKHEGKDDCSDQSHFQISRAGEKASKYPRAKLCSVSEHSDCQDDDGECDSGIGSYESETELSACSSPVHQETFDDQPFGCNKPAHSTDRPSSPEYILPEKSHQSPLKRRNPDARIPEVKPFVCYSCNCGFSEVSSLRAHVRHSHPRKGIAVGDFRCAFCLGSFSSIELLHDHVRSHQLPESNGYQSESNRVVTTYEKPKMSAKSLAFSIESICAETSPKSSPKHQVSHAYPSINSPHQSQLFNRMMMSSSPVSVRSSLASSLDRAYCSTDIHSHTDAFCQCRINMHHLYIR
ncbi:zinc finger protein ZFP2-like [Rhopilema esculentum]|uniref:zinc finger protein ZFP2-like n=1 Tax=Rhopilema esculentum TaxID=499914 RepID=UPI0031E16A73|eukprot:gene10206-18887_t